MNVKVAVLGAVPNTSGGIGGAERYYCGLVSGFQAIGCQVKFIPVVAEEPNFDAILENYQKAQQIDLSEFDMVVSTKAPTYAIRHLRHVVHLVHTVRVFDDMFQPTFASATDTHFRQRATLHAIDFESLRSAKALFTIGDEVADRLYRWRGLRAQVLHPPLGLHGFRNGEQGDYFFLPGRLHPWKRVDLAIDAVLGSDLPLKLVIAGTGEAENELRERAHGDPRIVFLGHIDDATLIDYYAGALAVPFVPLHEDFGYITLEAFASHKPVITCSDSGEPARLVCQHETGLICDPVPKALQRAMEWLHANREAAADMGNKGAQLVAGMSWENVARTLCNAAFNDSISTPAKPRTQVTVLDMQPIDPPVGGGRLRLLGLYHALGSDIDCTYVGSYDWPGESFRKHQLTPSLTEIDVPLSDAHHNAASALSRQAGGKTVIDIAFASQGHLSPTYIAEATRQLRQADVVVFSHPWVYPLVRSRLAPHQTVIYDSQNVEGFLRAQFLDEGNPAQARLLRDVIEVEFELCRRADLILACSLEDLRRFNRLYQVPADRIRLAPNGVMAFDHEPPSDNQRRAIQVRLGIDRWTVVAFFIGSPYGPNLEAAHFIADELAPTMPDILFVIGGGVGTLLHVDRPNVHLTGPLDDVQRKNWLAAAHVAINPMFSGSGTNIKMFDFMAMALPVASTAIGARGIALGKRDRETIAIVNPDVESFRIALGQLTSEDIRNARGKHARSSVEDGYAWERISPIVGQLFVNSHHFKGQPKPLFSVIVPTYERHAQLDQLMAFLAAQIDRDFEVVINDQSAMAWPGRHRLWGFPLVYHHSPVKGAVRARNTAATIAQGEILAFTDDDCQPEPEWLLNARRHFANNTLAGIEGLIHSDHLNDPNWRPVTNVGLEGIGFMTANLMVRNECFQLLGGFDLQFDHPHFREDTDLGWRLEELGSVPYAQDVRVFHPAQPRMVARESSSVRAAFFQNDALLWKKHPERYRDLFFKERHFYQTPGFSENIRIGFEASGMPIPQWMSQWLQPQ